MKNSMNDSHAKNRLKVICASMLCLQLLFAASTHASEGFTLVTEQEHADFLASLESAPEQILSIKSAVPSVLVESPALDGSEIKGPIDIIVRFITSDDASIDMKSLSISYGFFMDVTDRILAEAEIAADSFVVRNANVPKGKHRFTIRVKDSLGRQAEKEIKVVVI